MRPAAGAAAGAAAGLLAAMLAALPASASEAPPPLPFPVEIDLAFDLVDHTGARVTEADFAGRPLVLFFGYASCESICTVALPSIGAAFEQLGGAGAHVTPVMITIDPARDTPEAMTEALPRYHERMVGLTGSDRALADVQRRFQVEVTEVAQDPLGNPIYAHGSFIYLIGPEGRVRSALPPILAPERLAELIARHL